MTGKEKSNEKIYILLFALIIIALVMFIVFSSTYSTTTSSQNKLSFQTISKESIDSGVEKGNYVIKNSVEWKDLWLKAYSSRSPVPRVPDIDFPKEIVIAVFNGPEFTGGYSIEITNVVEDDKTVNIIVKKYSPGDNCAVSQSQTSPFHIVKIPRTEKEIGFTLEQQIQRC